MTSSNTHEQSLKSIIEETNQQQVSFDYKKSGYFKRMKNLDSKQEDENLLIRFGEYQLFRAWVNDLELNEERTRIKQIPNEEMPIQEHQVLRNLYFGTYPSSTKAKNAIRRMVKKYKELYADQANNNTKYFADLIKKEESHLAANSAQSIRQQLSNLNYE
tara:strand:- start:43 stop:522 length:480 start_codon:yes stop_codon:yes gene_type:complete